MDFAYIKQKIGTGEYDLSSHAHQERQEEKITIEEIEQAVFNGGIIEQYPNDPRGESCLVAGIVLGNGLHIVCGNRKDRILIITVYRPKQPIWIDLKTRAKELKSRV